MRKFITAGFLNDVSIFETRYLKTVSETLWFYLYELDINN